MEIYKLYVKILLALNRACDKGELPSSKTEATIIVICKEGKDPLQPSSYRPISLLCSDVKLLVRVLATRLSRMIEMLIYLDQSGFIYRVFVTLQVLIEERGSRVILSLNAAKAFNSPKWNYLWQVISVFKFRPVFIRWVRLLYSVPKERLRINVNGKKKNREIGADRLQETS